MEADPIETGVDAARREHPEWTSLLDLYQAALVEDARGAWEVRFSERLPGPATAPCLHGLELEVDGRRARRWLDRLLRRSSRSIEPLALLEAALCRDEAVIDRLAAAVPVETDVFRVIAQMAAF